MVNLDTCTVAFSSDIDDLARESICQSLQMSAVDYHEKYLDLPTCIYWLLADNMGYHLARRPKSSCVPARLEINPISTLPIGQKVGLGLGQRVQSPGLAQIPAHLNPYVARPARPNKPALDLSINDLY